MKEKLRKLWVSLATLFVVLPSATTVLATTVTPTTTSGEPVVKRDGCKRVIEKTEQVKWELPRQPIDLVILQDASGSFKETIGSINTALTKLTTPVSATDYDSEHPQLVFTENPATTDRVMIATYQGLDTVRKYTTSDYSDTPTTSDAGNYSFNKTGLISSQRGLKTFIDLRLNRDAASGGTPTVPAIDDVVTAYKEAKEAAGYNENRKTVFLLITDGVANGYRDKSGTEVFIDESDYRLERIAKSYGFDQKTLEGTWFTTDATKVSDLRLNEDYTVGTVTDGYSRVRAYFFHYAEGSQDFVKRSGELVTRGTKLKQELGENADVVIGFWEDLPSFKVAQQYGKGYEQDYKTAYNIETGETRSVRQTFQDSLKSMASDDITLATTGEKVSLYVNGQDDVDAFAENVLKAVTAAMVRENVEGQFTVTEGYTVDAVRINGKTVVSNPTNDKTEIRGSVVQKGNNVTISVPESVFNPGDNKFDYDLSRTTASENVSEDDEEDPAEDYVAKKEKIAVPQLTGEFTVGQYKTTKIGGKAPTSIEVEEIKYCYPSAKKSIADANPANDSQNIESKYSNPNDPAAGNVFDPSGSSKKASYGAVLDAADEEFTYTVDYNFNNSPYEWTDNAMLVDPLDHRLEYISATVQDLTNLGLTYTVDTMTQGANNQTVVYATIPKVPGSKTEDTGPYDGLVFGKARLIVKARLKEEYRKQGTSDYTTLLQLNRGYGVLNQASIMWNGKSTPDFSEHNAQTDEDGKVIKKSTIRRSNAVFVKPPVVTEVKKKVNNKEHHDLDAFAEEFTYTITTPWPGPVDSFKIEDKVVPELEIMKGSEEVTLGGEDFSELGVAATIDDSTNSISVVLDDATLIDDINSVVLDIDSENPQDIVLTFKAKIREGADLSKYTENGVIKVPNTADVILNGNDPVKSNKVTVTPPKPTEPEVAKKINGTLDNLTTFDNLPYTYNIVTTIPNDIASYKKFVISDTLDENLVIDGAVTIKDEAVASLFDIATSGQTVTAKVKEGKFADVAKLSTVELIIPAKVKEGYTGEAINNTAKVEFTNSKDEEKEKETEPVTVTPPSPTKKINDTLDHLDTDNEKEYTYNIKVALPTDIGEYKNFVITDVLDSKLSVFPGKQPSMKGDASNFFTVNVSGQTITASINNFEAANAFAGKEVELVIPAQINEDVSSPDIENRATIDFTNNSDQSGHKETKPVTVTPPPTEPTITKKIVDGKERVDAKTLDNETDYQYEIKVTLPSDIQKYTQFQIYDDVDERLTVQQGNLINQRILTRLRPLR